MRRIPAVGAAIILCINTPCPSRGQNPQAPPPSASAGAAAAGWRDAIKGAAPVRGLFTFYHRRDNALFLELAPSELERQFGMLTHVIRGPAGIASPGARPS